MIQTNNFTKVDEKYNNDFKKIAIKDLRSEIALIAIVDSERNLHELHINLSFFY
jgi:hypothetical protein